VRICFFITGLGQGGAERQLVTLVKNMANSGRTVEVVTCYSKLRLADELINAGIPVVSMNKQGRWDIFVFLFRLIQHFRTFKPDLIYSCLISANFFSVIVKIFIPKCKLVWTIRRSRTELTDSDFFANLCYKSNRLLSHFVDLVIVNSKLGAKMYISTGYPAEKTVVIPNGIDIDIFYPSSDLRKITREKWKIGENTILIGKVARVVPVKDHKTFLIACEMVLSKYDHVKIICVGDGGKDYIQHLQKFAKTLGIADKIIWTGYQKDMTAVYNALDVHVLTCKKRE